MKRKEEEEKVKQRQQALEEKQKAEKALRVKQEEERLRKKRQEEDGDVEGARGAASQGGRGSEMANRLGIEEGR